MILGLYVLSICANPLAQIRSSDKSVLLTDKGDILARWAEHFNELLKRQSLISVEAIASILQLPVKADLAELPNSAETESTRTNHFRESTRR